MQHLLNQLAERSAVGAGKRVVGLTGAERPGEAGGGCRPAAPGAGGLNQLGRTGVGVDQKLQRRAGALRVGEREPQVNGVGGVAGPGPAPKRTGLIAGAAGHRSSGAKRTV